MIPELGIVVIIVGCYTAAYAVFFPWYCGNVVRRLLPLASVLPFVVLLILWLYMQRQGVQRIQLGGWELHWLWYALGVLLASEWTAMHLYLRHQGLRYRDLWE